MIKLNVTMCKGCTYCVKFCPKHVLEMGQERNNRGYFYPVVTSPDRCSSCAVCANMCPEGAVELRKGED